MKNILQGLNQYIINTEDYEAPEVMGGGGGLRTESREFDCDVACNNVTASRSGLHSTTPSHFPRPPFFFFRLKKQQHLNKDRVGLLSITKTVTFLNQFYALT